ISIISNASFYILAYIPTYGVKTLHLPQSVGFTATLIGGLILAIGCPLAGHWSDKMTSRPLIMVITCWLFVLTPYPAFYLMAAWPSLATCIIAVAWLQLVKAGYSGVLPSLMSEQFPVDTRAVGVALGYSVSVSVFGGLAPLVATWLIVQTGHRLSPSYYLMFFRPLSLIALIAIQPPAALRRWCRSICATSPRSTIWRRRSTSAMAGSTFLSVMPASSAPSRRWAISTRGCGPKSSIST